MNLFYCLFLFFNSSFLNGQNYYSIDHPPKPGEEICYKIYYNWNFVWIPAGEVIFSVKENERRFLFDVNAYSYPSYDSFFKVRDRYYSEVDKHDLLPRWSVREINEGPYYRYDSIIFDQSKYELTEFYSKHKGSPYEIHFASDKAVLDMLSAIYFLRALDREVFEKERKIDFSIFFGKTLYDLQVNYLGVERKRLKSLGKHQLRHFTIELIDGYVFNEGDMMHIWVSDDNNNLPVLIESPIKFGSVKAIIKSARALRYPISVIETKDNTYDR